jgi:hypothetical protein
MSANPEPDGGLLVQALQSPLAMAALALVAPGRPRATRPRLSAVAPDFPGTLTVIRYLPDGTVAP